MFPGTHIVIVYRYNWQFECCLFQVLWADGRKSWVKETNLPKKVQELIKKEQEYLQSALPHTEFGQRRFELTFLENPDVTTPNEQIAVTSMQK